MPNTYEYKVTNLVRDQDGIVVFAEFSVTADDGLESYTHQYQTAFRNNPVTPTPFEEITESKVIEWIKRDVGASAEASADAELAAFKLRSEKVLTPGTPW